MGRENVVLIGAKSAADAVEALEAEATLEAKIRAAFEAVHPHWMVTDPDEQFQAGVAGLLSALEDEEEESVRRCVHLLEAVDGALSRGATLDLGDFPSGDGIEPAPLIRIWHEVIS